VLCRRNDITGPFSGRGVTDISELPASERAKRYRELAADAVREADKATGGPRGSYLIIAEQFKRLAVAAEAEAQREK
jgi:hypothetical protein